MIFFLFWDSFTFRFVSVNERDFCAPKPTTFLIQRRVFTVGRFIGRRFAFSTYSFSFRKKQSAAKKRKGVGGVQEMMGEGDEVPNMSPLDESLARASLTSGVHPPHANAIDYPLVAFFQMKSVPSDEHVQGILNKLAKFPRFRCKVEPVLEGNVLGKLHWVPTEIRFQKHVTRKDDVHSQEELDEIKNELLVKPLQTDVPLFDVFVLSSSKGRSNNRSKSSENGDSESSIKPVLAIRYSHAIGDGVHAVKVLEHIACGLDGEPVKIVHWKRSKKKKEFKNAWAMMLDCLYFVWVFMVGFCRAVFTAFGPADNKTVIRDEPVKWSGKREITTSTPIALEELKAVRAAFKCTINDVVVSCIAGAVQRYMEARDCPFTKKPSTRVRAIIPFATIPKKEMENMKKDPYTLKNLFTFVSLRLSMGPCSATERLKRTMKKTYDLKRSPEAAITIFLNAIIGKLGSAMQKQSVYDYMSRHSMVLTNVPGPVERVRLAGIEVETVDFACANLINQVSVLSYAGEIRLTLVTDPEVVKDAHTIAEYFLKEIKSLKIAADKVSSEAAAA